MLVHSFLRIYITLLFTSLIYVTTGFSQSISYLDSLDGKFALQFQITDNFNLSDFQGTIFSGKYHFSKRDAIRLGLSLSLSDSDGEEKDNLQDSINVNTSKIERNYFTIEVNAQYIRYIKGTDDIAFFVGGGPFINYFTSTSNGETNVNEIAEKYKFTDDSYSFGMDFLVGLEWWFHKYMSLSAEYGLRFMYSSHDRMDEREMLRRELSENLFRITANHINFGITVYF